MFQIPQLFRRQDALGNMGVSGAPQVFGASAIVAQLSWESIEKIGKKNIW
jgi:hypothetical protein